MAHAHRFELSPEIQREPLTLREKAVGVVRRRWRVAALLAVGGAALWSVLYLGPLSLTHVKGQLSPDQTLAARNAARQTLVQLLAGMALFAGLVFTARTYRVTRESHLTDRFSKSVAQLGDEKMAVRTGAIYSLARLAEDSPADRQNVIEVLCSYLRDTAALQLGDSDASDALKVDVRAVLRVLGTRAGAESEAERLDLRLLDLRGHSIRGEWQHANFAGSRLQNVSFVRANLCEASLHDADVSGGSFAGANLERSFLAGLEAHDVFFLEANLTQANLQRACLNGADFTGRKRPDGSYRSLPATLTGANLSEANLTDALLHGVDLRDVTGLTAEQLSRALMDESTQLPVGMEHALRVLQASLQGATKASDAAPVRKRTPAASASKAAAKSSPRAAAKAAPRRRGP